MSDSTEKNNTKSFSWTSFGITNVGKARKLNEDSMLVKPETGMWVVADGMGGHEAGDVASQMVVNTLKDVPKGISLEKYIDDIGYESNWSPFFDGIRVRFDNAIRNKPTDGLVPISEMIFEGPAAEVLEYQIDEEIISIDLMFTGVDLTFQRKPAYSYMIEEMYGEKVEQIIILIAVENDLPQIFIADPYKYIKNTFFIERLNQ